MNIGARVLDIWLDKVLWARLAQMQFLEPRPQSQEIFWDFMILLDFPDHSWENEVCLWKLEPGFWTYGLITPLPKALGPNCPKLVFRPQTTNVRVLGSEIFFISSSIKFAWNKLLFSNCGSFLTKLWVFICRKLQKEKIAKIPFKNMCHFRCVILLSNLDPSKSCLKKPCFLEH